MPVELHPVGWLAALLGLAIAGTVASLAANYPNRKPPAQEHTPMKYAKFYVAIAAVLAVLGQILADGEVTGAEWGLLATTVAGAIGVRQITNTPTSTPPADRGDFDVVTLLVFVIGFGLGFLFGRNV